jgi:hypothetical protein
MLTVIMLNVENNPFMLSVVKLNVVLLSVVAPSNFGANISRLKVILPSI